jgi:hypothetical protein
LRKFIVPILALLAAAACSSVKSVVSHDIPLETQQQILEEYQERYVWARVTLQDLGEGGTIPRDEKVKIVDVGMIKRGSVTVETLKKKNRIVQGLDLAAPLSKAKIDSAMAEFFWFEDPVLRQVAFIRKYGKETAKLIMNHQLVAGMGPDAARDSWGKPAKTSTSERNNVVQERWTYPSQVLGKSKNIDFENGKVKRWDE